MNWQFTVQDALFLFSVLIFAIIGYQRGWRREVISLLFIIVGVVFLNLSGGFYLSRLLYQFLVGRTISDQDLLHTHTNVLLFVTIGTLAVIIALGYAIGNRISRDQKILPQDRTLGLIPGIIAGAVVAAELTFSLLPNIGKSVITTGTIQINLSFLGNLTVLLIFVIAVVVVVIGLMAIRPKKAGGGGGEKK